MERIAPLVFLSAILMTPVNVAAQNYTFRVIATTGPQYTTLFNPTIGPNGDVAALTNPAAGGVGIIRSSAGQTQLVFTTTSGIGGFLTADGQGRILFNLDGQVMSLALGSAASVFADSGLMVPFGEESGLFACQPSLPGSTISTAGAVPLSCVFDSVPGNGPFFSLQRFNGSGADRVCDTGRSRSNPGQPVFPTCVAQGLPGGGSPVAISPNGLFAVIVESQSDSAPPQFGIATGTPAGLQTVLTDSQLGVSGAQFMSVSVNDSGDVAFAASDPTLSSSNVFVVDALGQFRPLVQLVGPTSVGGFGSAFNISINAAGRVVFDANRWIQSGVLGQGLYTGPDPVRDKVIEYGNFLPGFTKSVTELELGQPGINDAGQIVFVAGLSDGRRVLVVAEPVKRRLTVTKVGSGTVTSAPAGIDCGTNCVGDYPENSVVTLTATPAPGFGFLGFTRACVTTNATCSVTMSAAKTITATFARFPLTVTTAGTGAGSVSGDGIACARPAGVGNDCTESYPAGTLVALTAAPTSPDQSAFTGWTGACVTTNATCLVTMNAANAVTATFSSVKLTVTRVGPGRVTSDVPGVECGTDCVGDYAPNKVVTLTAQPLSPDESIFKGWTGACVTTNATCLVTMNAVKAVTATATFSSVKLTVTRVGPGRVTSDVPGVDCGTDCVGDYAANKVVTLTAQPLSPDESIFKGWTGACVTTNATCLVTMNAVKAVTATFSSVKLTVTRVGPGRVTSDVPGVECGTDCVGDFAPNKIVTLTAQPLSPDESIFKGWTGACVTTNAACLVTMNAAKTVTATFASLKLTVTRVGSGTVTSAPAGIDCNVDCVGDYAPNRVVTLTATAAPGFGFLGFTGACVTANATCNVTMSAAKAVTATFARFPLTVTSAGTGAGSVTGVGIVCVRPTGVGNDCSESYPAGEIVTLTATPAVSSGFVGWTGACTGNASCIVTMSAARAVTATFKLLPP